MDETSGAVTEVIKTAGRYGSDIFLTVVILIAVFGFIGVYIWRVAIPNAESDRKTNEEMAKVIAALGTVVGEIRHIVDAISGTTGKTSDAMSDVVRSVLVSLTVLERLTAAAKIDPDIKSELGQIKGMLSRWAVGK